MTAYPGFGVVLQRLLEHRGTAVAELAASSGVAESEVRAVLDGAAPSAEQLHALAPALGFHLPDLFVLADAPVPAELTPLDPKAGHVVGRLAKLAVRLPPDQRRRLRQQVDDLPQEPRPDPDPHIAASVSFSAAESGFGAVFAKLICANRNLRRSAAYTVAALTYGRMYLSPSTYYAFGNSATKLRPDWIVCLGAVMDLDIGDLAAITGIELPEAPFTYQPLLAEIAELVWACRRLSEAQTKQVYAAAEALLVPIPAGAPEAEWNYVCHRGDSDVWWGAPRTPGEWPGGEAGLF